MAIEVSFAEMPDADLLAVVGRETFIEAFEGRIHHGNLMSFANKRFGPQQQAAELAQPSTIFFIARRDGEAAGYAKLCESVAPPCIAANRAVELERLYLYGKWHGLGVAHALMDVCLTEARRRAYEGMWLDVWDENTRAQAFYRKHLFELVGGRPYAVGAEEQWHLLMFRELADVQESR